MTQTRRFPAPRPDAVARTVAQPSRSLPKYQLSLFAPRQSISNSKTRPKTQINENLLLNDACSSK
jgi:hypothetical protein